MPLEMEPVSWGRGGLLPGSGSAGGTVNQSWHPHPGQRGLWVSASEGSAALSRLQGCHLLSPQVVWPLWSVLGIRFSSKALASCLLFNWEHGLSQDQNPHSPPRSYLASL
uniref:Uncharacterized protein n=1 Tax=Colobus angolensis palliatus TaxID=336983 RepID=A0A2K5HL99_COLAP